MSARKSLCSGAGFFSYLYFSSTLRSSIVSIQRSKSIPDGSVASVTIEVYSSVYGTKRESYTVDVKGFTTKEELRQNILDANAKIDKATVIKEKPRLRERAMSKTAINSEKSDFILPLSTNGLIFSIANIVKSNDIPDGTTATLTIKVESNIPGSKIGYYTVDVSGYCSEANLKEINDANAEIDKVIEEKLAPEVNRNSWDKTASKVTKNDFLPFEAHGTLHFMISNVRKSTASPDGRTVTVTIEVSSNVLGTKTGHYDVEVTRFKSEAALAAEEEI